MNRRTFLNLGCATLFGGTVMSGVGTAYATVIEPRWIEVTRLDINLPRWPTALTHLTIAQLSDLHLGEYVDVDNIRHAVEITNQLGADLVLLTGDFVYHSEAHSVLCAQELAALGSRYGVYAVLGNHDIWTDGDYVANQLTTVGIRVLHNEGLALEIRGERLWLLGIEDTGYTGFVGSSFDDFQSRWQGRANALAHLLDPIPDPEPRLLAVHNPDFTEMLLPGQIDLALCGHTHGGQVKLPFIGAPVLPSCWGQKYAGGLVQSPGSLVYVNRGIGLIWPPVRFNCRPEITVLRIKPTQAGH